MMKKLNMARLLKEIKGVTEYTPPEKGRGYSYLYERLYLPFVNGQDIPMGGLDLDAFSSEDVLELSADFYDCFSRYPSRNDTIKRALRNAAPLPSAVSFL